jgi:hypothetical protein
MCLAMETDAHLGEEATLASGRPTARTALPCRWEVADSARTRRVATRPPRTIGGITLARIQLCQSTGETARALQNLTYEPKRTTAGGTLMTA